MNQNIEVQHEHQTRQWRTTGSEELGLRPLTSAGIIVNKKTKLAEDVGGGH